MGKSSSLQIVVVEYLLFTVGYPEQDPTIFSPPRGQSIIFVFHSDFHSRQSKNEVWSVSGMLQSGCSQLGGAT
jgi:hypothetical protein